MNSRNSKFWGFGFSRQKSEQALFRRIVESSPNAIVLEQSKYATSQVRTVPRDIQNVTSAAVMAIEQGAKAVESGMKLHRQAVSGIRSIGHASPQNVDSSCQVELAAQNRHELGLKVEKA